jgi:hypothetical protein
MMSSVEAFTVTYLAQPDADEVTVELFDREDDAISRCDEVTALWCASPGAIARDGGGGSVKAASVHRRGVQFLNTGVGFERVVMAVIAVNTLLLIAGLVPRSIASV